MRGDPKIMPREDELHADIHDMLQEPWDLLGHDWELQQGSLPVAVAASTIMDDKVKRVSLDATETWMSDDEAEEDRTTVGMWASLDGFVNSMGVDSDGPHTTPCLLPPHISTTGAAAWDDTVPPGQEDMMMLDESNDDSPSSPQKQKSIATMLEERRSLLAASMQRSQASRKCFLDEHLTTRANLARVLNDIERSSHQVSAHLLHSGGSTSGSNSSLSGGSTHSVNSSSSL